MDHYIRLVVFAVEGCPQPLVELFLKKARADTRPGVPYSTIDAFLQHHQPIIQTMLKRKFIHAGQLSLVLPSQSDPAVDITKWDISLVTTMLQNIFNPLSPLEQQYIGDIRSIRNELHHHSGTAELDDNDFTAKWNTLETAVTGLAQCVSTNFYNEMTRYIMELKTKSLPPPGPVLDILKQWYNSDKELHQDTKLTMAASKGSHSILNAVVVRSKNHSGAVLKKIKTVDRVLENMKEQFKLTMNHYKSKDYRPPHEIEDILSKFRRNHRVVITGKGNLESALTLINDANIRHDRCVQVTELDEYRHVYCDDVDLVLCINPFGNDIYDDKKATAMTKQFDRMLENATLDETDGRIGVVIVSETEPFIEYCRFHEHDILDQVVALNKQTTETEPIHVLDCVKKTISQPEPILQNMIGHSGLYFEQFRGLLIDEKLCTRAKHLFKKHKAITITGPTNVRKEILAVRLMREHRPDECLVLMEPGDWKYVKLGYVSVLLISNFTGKCECDSVLYTKWLSIFDLIHAAVKSGKLNVMLTSHSIYLEKCQEQKGTHDLLEQRVKLTAEDVKTNIKIESDAPQACMSSQDNETVSDGPYSYIRESCLTYRGKYTPQLDEDGKGGEIGSFCTVSDGTFLMTVSKRERFYLYHVDASYKYIRKRTLQGMYLDSALLCLNKREAAVSTNDTGKISIVSLSDGMRVQKTISVGTLGYRSAMAYNHGDFFIASYPDTCKNIDVHSVTGAKVRTITYDRECGKDDNGELMVIKNVDDIAVSEDRIVLAVFDNVEVIYILCLKMNGERNWLLNIGKSTRRLIVCPRMYLDEKCNIYYIEETRREIHCVSACGQLEVLLKYPDNDLEKMCIDVKRHLLYLTYGDPAKTLHAYQLFGRETRY